MLSGKVHGQANQQGFVYIALLIGLAIIGIGLGATSEVWTLTRQREKEQELLWVGNQFRQAISRFYLQSPPAARRFPLTLEELLEDVRTPDKPQRFLRQLYPDPITNSTRWGEVRLPSGQLVGVYSESTDTPLKTAGFALRDKTLLDASRYSEWVFRSALPAANPVLKAGEGYNTSGSPAAPARPLAPPTTRPNNATTPPGFIQPTPRPR
jgi:type II secretory pathway pseudopilin PulG